MIKLFILSLITLIFKLVNGDQTVLTTTLNNLQERSIAVLDQENFISAVMLNAATDYEKYTTVMRQEGLEFPPELLQFIIEISTYQISEFPTSVYISTFPFDQFQTFITHFSWISDYYSEYDVTSFKVPSDYSVITTTIELDAKVSSFDSSNLSSKSISIISSTVDSYKILSTSQSISNSISSSTRIANIPTSTAISKSFSSSSSSSSSPSSSPFVSPISSTHNNANSLIIPNTLLFFLVSLFL